MRIDRVPPLFSIQTQLSEHGCSPKPWVSSLCSLCSPSRLFNRLKFYLTAPFTFLRTFFFPKTSPLYIPEFSRTIGKDSEGFAIIGKEFSQNEQTLLLDQFDKIVSYVEKIAANNWGKVEVTLRFAHEISHQYGSCKAKELAAERGRFIDMISKIKRMNVEFVVDVTCTFSSWFGKRSKQIHHAVLVKTENGIQFT